MITTILLPLSVISVVNSDKAKVNTKIAARLRINLEGNS